MFIDTSAILALINRKERHHSAAIECRDNLPSGTQLVTSTDIFDETMTRARTQLGHSAAVALGRALREDAPAAVLPVEPLDRERAWQTFEQRTALVLSHTDCTTAAMMDRLGIHTIFTFDDDFRRLGRTVVP